MGTEGRERRSRGRIISLIRLIVVWSGRILILWDRTFTEAGNLAPDMSCLYQAPPLPALAIDTTSLRPTKQGMIKRKKGRNKKKEKKNRERLKSFRVLLPSPRILPAPDYFLPPLTATCFL